MSMRLTHVPRNSTTGEATDPIGFETTYDGQTFFWAHGQTRNLADDGQAVGHAGNSGAGSPATGVVEDNALSLKYYPDYASRA